METFLLRMFQRQVLLQAEWILFAAEDLNSALQRYDHSRAFYSIQSMLTATANISKALWGQGGKQAVPRAVLRESLGVSEDSPLADTLMRNNYDHFDERLETWWRESVRHNSVSLHIGAPSRITRVDDIDRFREIDPQTGKTYFWGQEFDLAAIVAEVQRLMPRLRSEAAKPHYDLPPDHPAYEPPRT